MQSFFSINSLFYKVMYKLWGLLVLNLMILITSLPIITIGAAQTAGFLTTTKIINVDETKIVSAYIDSFRKNFKQSTVIWIFLLVVLYVLSINWYYLIVYSQLTSWMTIGMATVTFLVGSIGQYIFFYISRFDDSLKQILLNIIKITVYYPTRSMILLLIMVLPCTLMLLSPYLFVFGMYISIFIGISFTLFLRTFLLLDIFNRVKI